MESPDADRGGTAMPFDVTEAGSATDVATLDREETMSPSEGGDGEVGVDAPDGGSPPIGLGMGCDVPLRPVRSLQVVAGTLGTSGPYRPCGALGGQTLQTIRLSGDGLRVAALGAAGEVEVLDARTLATIGTFSRSRGPYNAFALATDGTYLAAGDEADGELDVWRVDDHELLRAADLGKAWSVFGGAVAISADGAMAAASSGPATVILDVATGKTSRSTDQGGCCANALVFVDGGRKVASARYDFWAAGTNDANVALLDLATGVWTPLARRDDIYGQLTLDASADGSTVLTYRRGEAISLWDAATGASRGTMAAPAGPYFDAYFGLSRDGSEVGILVIDASQTNMRAQRRRFADGAVVDEVRVEANAAIWAWSLDSDVMLVEPGPSADGLRVVALDARRERVLARACGTPVATGGDAVFSQDGSRALARSSDGLVVFDVASGLPLGPGAIAVGQSVGDEALSPDGRRVAWTPGLKGNETTLRVQLTDVDTGAERTLSATRDASAISSVRVTISPDSRLIAAQDPWNGVLDVFDADTGLLLAQQTLGAGDGWLMGFSADGETVKITREDDIETLSWRDGTVVHDWNVPCVFMTNASFDTSTMVCLPDDGPIATAYRDEMVLATMPAPDRDCFAAWPFAVLALDGTAVALGTTCGRPWTATVAPHVDIYDTGTGALVQSFPTNEGASLSWDGMMLAFGGNTLWCR
jgi:WD40 repeat protein